MSALAVVAFGAVVCWRIGSLPESPAFFHLRVGAIALSAAAGIVGFRLAWELDQPGQRTEMFAVGIPALIASLPAVAIVMLVVAPGD